jgi:hypothetical protein
MHQGNAQRHYIDWIIHQPRMLLVVSDREKAQTQRTIPTVSGIVRIEKRLVRESRARITFPCIDSIYGYRVLE